MIKSDFNYYISNGVLAIEDQNLGRMSVTNDMENVLEYIKNELNDKMPNLIVYKDSDGIWDGVSYKEDKVKFYPIQTTVFHIASNLAKE